MLSRIENITTNTDYAKGNSRVHFQLGNNQYPGMPRNVHNDSLNFSPAYQLLQKLKWKLKSIKQKASKEFLCCFEIGNFEFSSKTEISSQGVVENICYDVFKENWHLNLVVTFKVRADKTEALTENRNFLRAFDTLFDRLALIKVDNEIDRTDNIALNYLMDGISDNLHADFDFINYNLLTFLEWHFNVKFNLLSTKNSEKITLDRIKIIND